ncbi:unnamed protein product [Peniophora sp. CBMAI 1063]|nr:unnamed protein product [Peniophora sp. CBMAI 1063]
MSFFVNRATLGLALISQKILHYALEVTMNGHVYNHEHANDRINFRNIIVKLHALLRAYEAVGGNLSHDRTLERTIRGFVAFTEGFIAQHTEIVAPFHPQILYFKPEMCGEIETFLYRQDEHADEDRYPQTQAAMQSVMNFFVWRTDTESAKYMSWLWDEVRQNSGAIQESNDTVSFLYRPAAMGEIMSPASCIEISRAEFEANVQEADLWHEQSVPGLRFGGSVYEDDCVVGSSQQATVGSMES